MAALQFLVVVMVVFASAEQKTITAECGQDVALTCGAPNNNIIVVEWSRADLKSEHVFVWRNHNYDPDNQHPSFKNRAQLRDRRMKDADVSLILQNVTTADAGTYECRVSTEENSPPEPISTIYLRVAPPGPPGGTSEDGGKEGKVSNAVSRGQPGLLAILVAVVVLIS